MIMLYKEGYIDGIELIPLMNGNYDIKLIEPAITLKGLEYLETNSVMNKAFRALKGIKEITPGL